MRYLIYSVWYVSDACKMRDPCFPKSYCRQVNEDGSFNCICPKNLRRNTNCRRRQGRVITSTMSDCCAEICCRSLRLLCCMVLLTGNCDVNKDERVRCAWNLVKPIDCLQKGCCYDDREDPYCFLPGQNQTYRYGVLQTTIVKTHAANTHRDTQWQCIFVPVIWTVLDWLKATIIIIISLFLLFPDPLSSTPQPISAMKGKESSYLMLLFADKLYKQAYKSLVQNYLCSLNTLCWLSIRNILTISVLLTCIII